MDFNEIDISPELREKAKAYTSPEELPALAKKEGYKLSEQELEAVSGGFDWNQRRNNYENTCTSQSMGDMRTDIRLLVCATCTDSHPSCDAFAALAVVEKMDAA